MARPSMGLERINLLCDPPVIAGYRWLAKTRSTTYSELIRAAMKEYLVREIQKEQADIRTLAGVGEENEGDTDNGRADPERDQSDSRAHQPESA